MILLKDPPVKKALQLQPALICKSNWSSSINRAVGIILAPPLDIIMLEGDINSNGKGRPT